METKKHEDRFKVVEDKVLKNSYFILDKRFGILLGPYGRDAFEKAEDLNSVGPAGRRSLSSSISLPAIARVSRTVREASIDIEKRCQ